MKKKKIQVREESFEEIDLKHIPLGFRLRDKVSGFEGTSISRTVFFNGCVQYQLKPRMDKDNKIVDAQLFDCQQLEILNRGLAPKEIKEKKSPPGGDMPDTPKLL